VAKPSIDLNARNFGFGDQNEFLIASRQLEDTAVSAFNDLVPQIQNPNILAIAARMLSTEGYHAGNVREQIILRGLTAPHIDAQDILPVAAQFFPTDANGLAPTRFIAQ